MLPPAVLWVDPGEVTGLARYEVNNSKCPFWAMELPATEAAERIWSYAVEWRMALVVGWERYTIGATTHKLTPQPAALEMIGVCKFITKYWHLQTLQPAQQHTPDKIDRERLLKLGWWVPGKDDAQSAAAHMLNWMLREGELPPREREILGK